MESGVIAERSSRRLGHGQFFGLRRSNWDVGGFSIASMRADPGIEVEMHTHDTAHFIVLTSGQYLTSARGAGAVCVRPAVIYNPPGTTHSDTFRRVDGRVDGSFVSIALSATRLREIGDDVTLVDEPLYSDHRATVALALRLARETRNWNDESALITEAICLELAAHASLGGSGDRTQGSPGWLRVARDMLRAHCVESVSVTDIARACDVHPVYLARTFRSHFGSSPGEYLRRCRVERAAAMLVETRASLSMVAVECGYSDQSHFSTAFRNAYDTTPAEYRRLSMR